MYQTLLTGGLLLGGGIVAAELTCVTCAAIESYSEYKSRITEYRTATSALQEIPYQKRPRYKSIFWKNLKEVHAKILRRS